MKKPVIPPKLDFTTMLADMPATHKEEYVHWDALRYKKPPEGLTAEQWWFTIKLARRALGPKQLAFSDTDAKPFTFVVPNVLLPKLANIDRQCGGLMVNVSAYNKNKYLVNSLIEESISSSQLEGASTTRRIAKDMLLSQRKPRTEDELMIYNNYRAMQFIKETKSETLTLEFILEIHRILTENILEDAGCLRTGNDIHVVDPFGEILHTPPSASELEGRLKKLCQFANTDETQEKNYIHPVVKAILLHFELAYDHPFSDGNGRTARAIFYWFMLNRGYRLMEYISISQIIKKAPVQYGRAFLYTETDDNDVTYFIFHQIKIIQKGVQALHNYIESQNDEIQRVEASLHNNQNLNYRQLVLLQHALKNPGTTYLIEHHRQSHHVTYQTARTDLLKLEQLGLFSKQQRGKAFVFLAPADLKKRLELVNAKKLRNPH